jgi:hypothetical protein
MTSVRWMCVPVSFVNFLKSAVRKRVQRCKSFTAFISGTHNNFPSHSAPRDFSCRCGVLKSAEHQTKTTEVRPLACTGSSFPVIFSSFQFTSLKIVILMRSPCSLSVCASLLITSEPVDRSSWNSRGSVWHWRWPRRLNPLKPKGKCMYHLLYQSLMFCLCGFCMIFSVNTDHFLKTALTSWSL